MLLEIFCSENIYQFSLYRYKETFVFNIKTEKNISYEYDIVIQKSEQSAKVERLPSSAVSRGLCRVGSDPLVVRRPAVYLAGLRSVHLTHFHCIRYRTYTTFQNNPLNLISFHLLTKFWMPRDSYI